ncbi:hypothetical protein FRB99_005939 [Tulasnella sp. 403]|nr:hypothetical protein FRB99_005939 [Tulasnella sp. 403]
MEAEKITTPPSRGDINIGVFVPDIGPPIVVQLSQDIPMVYDLQAAIVKQFVEHFRPLSTPNLLLYKVDWAFTEWLKWENAPVLPGEAVDLFASVADIWPEISDRAMKISVLAVPYTPRLQAVASQVQAPSSRGTPGGFREAQTSAFGPVIFCHRPYTAASVPVTLLDPILGQFVDDCDTYCPCPEDLDFVIDLTNELCGFFSDKEARADLFRSMFGKYCVPLSTTVMTQDGETDGHALEGEFLYLITECRLEIGSGGTEPILKAGLRYLEHLREIRSRLEDRMPWPCPCFNISYAGCTFFFSGLAFSDRPHLDILSLAVPLSFHHTDKAHLISAARIFGAAKKAILALRAHYQSITAELSTQTVRPTTSLPRRPFPYANTYTSLSDATEMQFSYLEQSPHGNLHFIAESQSRKSLFIKFVHKYNKEVHMKCADKGIAPPLYGYETLPGGWIMVVMEEVGQDYKPYVPEMQKDGFTFPPREDVCQALKEAVDRMHSMHIVHGDVRNVNVLVKRIESMSDGPPVLLCDFDWAGHVGEARYPLDVNRKDISRPAGAIGGELITKEHDLQMMSVL